MKETRHIELFDITAAFVHPPVDEFIVLLPPVGIVQPGQGLLLRRARCGTRKGSKFWAKTCSKVLGQRRMWKHLWKGLGKFETLRTHFETKRPAVVGPGRDSEVRFLSTHGTLVECQRCFAWSADLAQAEPSRTVRERRV